MNEIFVDSNTLLKSLKISNAKTIFNLIDENRKYFRRWLAFVDNTTNVEDVENFILASKSVNCPKKDLTFEIWYNNILCGLIGFKEVDHQNYKTEIGYWISEEYGNKGIVTQCCKALLFYGFSELKMNRIQIKTGVGNVASSRIPEKLGFTLEGIERSGEYFNGQYIDLEVYSMLNDDWTKQM